MLEYLATLPSFILYFGIGVLLCATFLLLYLVATPQREIALIRAGNVSAALCLGGALLGYALPVASAISHAVAPLDLVIWGAVALVVQFLAYLLMRLWLRDLRAHVEADRVSVGVTVAAVSVSVGLLNAAAMTY